MDRETDPNAQANTAASHDPARRRFLRLLSALPVLSACAMMAPSLLRAAPLGVEPQRLEPIADPFPPSPSRKPQSPRLLMIDPGHGGHDPGAIGLSGTKEKDITLDIAQRMADVLARETGIDVRLTREHDVFLPLPERVKLGREARADMFISIHADSAPNQGARGLSAYTLSEKASDQFANMLAEQENKVDLLGGLDLGVEDKDVASILFDLAARRTRNTAQRVKVGFIKAVGRNWQLLEEPMRSANFAVLRSPDVPSMLIETGFLSNPRDESLLRRSDSRQKIATLMAKELAFLLRSPLFG